MEEPSFSSSLEQPHHNRLLEGPSGLVLEVEKKRERNLTFTFNTESEQCTFGHSNGKPYITLEIFTPLPDALPAEQKEKFSREIITDNGVQHEVHILKIGDVPPLWKPVLPPGGDRPIIDEEGQRYHIAEPRVVAKRHEALPSVPVMTVDELAEWLTQHHVIFYTGAGISKASGVPDMNEFKRLVGLLPESPEQDLKVRALEQPQKLLNAWHGFVQIASEARPTPAHTALTTVAKKIQAPIFTENVDYLHEHTGVSVNHITGPWLQEHVRPEWLTEVDAVVTIGLSVDDRGFLAWYKEHNPAGKIIAIDMNQPRYLGPEDGLVKGDCQEIVAALEQQMQK